MIIRLFLLVFFWCGAASAEYGPIGEINVNVPVVEESVPSIPEDRSTLWVRSGPRIYLLVKDARGRKTGVDAKSRKVIQDIPNSQCAADFIQNKYTGEQDELDETITFEPAAPGRYIFTLTGLQPGPYRISLSALGRGGSSLPSKEVEGLISAGEQKVFTLDFQPEATNALSVIEEHR